VSDLNQKKYEGMKVIKRLFIFWVRNRNQFLVLCVVFVFLSLRSVSCAKSCPCLWIFHSWLLVRISLMFSLSGRWFYSYHWPSLFSCLIPSKNHWFLFRTQKINNLLITKLKRLPICTPPKHRGGIKVLAKGN
jgi:hypothetical protein